MQVASGPLFPDLRYIGQVEFRQAIEKQLDKVELANGFTRAVAVGKPRRLEHSDKEDQEIAEAETV